MATPDIGLIDYHRAKLTVSYIEKKGRYRAWVAYKVQDGMRQTGVDDQGRPTFEPSYKWAKRSKLLSPKADTKRKADTEAREWIDSLDSEQRRAASAIEGESLRAEQEAREAKDQARRESMPTPYKYVSDYITSLRRSGRVAERTVDDYESAAKHLTRFGDAKLDQLTREDVQGWINDLNGEYAPLTVRKAFQLLKRALDVAEEDSLVKANPCNSKRISLPKVRTIHGKNSLTVEDMRVVADLLRSKVQTPYVVAAQIAMQTGLREGEICAITWGAVNFRKMEIRIEQGITRANHGSSVAPTKRASSDRVLPINSELEKVLKARRARMMEQCMSAGIPHDRKSFNRLYVIGGIDGSYYQPHRISTSWRVIAETEGIEGANGKPLTFHDLRHSYATTAIVEGADVMSVASNLGHSDPHITLKTYANADPVGKRHASDKVADATAPRSREVIPFRSTGTNS
jgi:integrase